MQDSGHVPIIEPYPDSEQLTNMRSQDSSSLDWGSKLEPPKHEQEYQPQDWKVLWFNC
jgi:hypothetical protein